MREWGSKENEEEHEARRGERNLSVTYCFVLDFANFPSSV